MFSINARKEFSVDLTLFSSEQAVNKNPEWKLKDFLINNNVKGFYDKFVGYLTQNKILKQKTITQIIKEFIADDLFSKRNTLIYLLIKKRLWISYPKF